MAMPPTAANLGAQQGFANPRKPADILPRNGAIAGPHETYAPSLAKIARRRGVAKSTKARTFGTESRPNGETR